MKRLLTVTLALLSAVALASVARADVIWEPMDNPFYAKHRSQCEYINRSYYANGQEGFVTLWDAPDGSVVRAQFKNGGKLWVSYIYDNAWGLIDLWEGHTETSGWVSLEDLELVYDYICFQEDYGDRITPYAGEFADYDGDAETVNFYAYPGAPEVAAAPKAQNVLDHLTGAEDGTSYITSVFVDEDGRAWGFVGYLYGRMNSWFCLDQPDGTDFPVRDVARPELVPARTPTLPLRGYTPYALVAAVVIVTAGLLAVFYGKRKKTTD